MKVLKCMRAGFRAMSLHWVASLTTLLALGAGLVPGAAAQSKEETVDLGNGVKLELVWIPAGTFVMGSPENEQDREEDEGPQQEVTLSTGFRMGKYEVTQEQWAAVMENNPSGFKGRKNPVERVSWNDCQEFIKRLCEKIGAKGFRLPTEAEWEYACRAGSKTSYNFGDDRNQLENYAWYDGNSGSSTHPVGHKKPNAWGLYDMHGNVWEWCQDPWHEDYQGAPADGSVWEAGGSSFRVVRGGSWYYTPADCRAAHRARFASIIRDLSIGFRVRRGVPIELLGALPTRALPL